MKPIAGTSTRSTEAPGNPTNALRLFIVRHGETAWSLSGQYTGRTDLPLTERGKVLARKLGLRLQGVSFTRVFSSPLIRAIQTCDLTGLSKAPEIDPDLTEWDNGSDEGRMVDDIRKDRPDWNLFRDGAPNGESPEQIGARADRCIARLRGLHGNVALFTHGHFGRVFAARWIGLPVCAAERFLLDTASLSVVCYEHGNTEEPAVALWNSPACG